MSVITCRGCGASSHYKAWPVRKGSLRCPDCGRPEYHDEREEQLADLAKEGNEEAQADFYKEIERA